MSKKRGSAVKRPKIFSRRADVGGSKHPPLTGAVLAGGQSRRMGQDKAELRVGARPMWQRQVRVLRAAGAESVLVVRRPEQAELGKRIRNLRDEFSDAGPLAGLHVAIGAAETPLIAVLAVDMPRIDAAWFRWLLTFCRSDCGAVVQHHDGFEPLAAIYPRDAFTTIKRRLERGERSLQQLVVALARSRRMTIVPLPEHQRWRVTNWNTPQEMASL